jgi:hypothetical protein
MENPGGLGGRDLSRGFFFWSRLGISFAQGLEKLESKQKQRPKKAGKKQAGCTRAGVVLCVDVSGDYVWVDVYSMYIAG